MFKATFLEHLFKKSLLFSFVATLSVYFSFRLAAVDRKEDFLDFEKFF